MFYSRALRAVGMAGILLVAAAPAPAAASTTQDVAFAQAAHQNNLAEVAAGKVAFRKSKDPVVKELAATFMRDHIRMDAELARTARKLEIHLPATPSDEQQALVRRYEAAGADTFDEYYISTQLVAHREAHELAATQAEKGADPALRNLAEKATGVIDGHRDLLRAAAVSEGMAGYVEASGRAPRD
ncbi:DUF4142 domain-containing protein [Actinoplanes sp. NPDC023801]|uniref:DUF4142 domain-containing protein n=1 Tax=Actinoplanes sp. NPDC023801 TaxID=3154595 RepID=UPI0033F6DD2A